MGAPPTVLLMSPKSLYNQGLPLLTSLTSLTLPTLLALLALFPGGRHVA